MMANWEKLNKEFDQVFNSLQDLDWEQWDSVRASRKEMRRLELLLKAKIQEEKIKFSQLSSELNEIINQSAYVSEQNITTSCVSNTSIEVAGENNYALAA